MRELVMFVDWPLERLRAYMPERYEPADFDEFWATTLKEARAPAAPRDSCPTTPGSRPSTSGTSPARFAGQPVRGWFYLPRGREGRLPCVVQYLGYSNGRGFPVEWLDWSAAGYAHLVMDTRGQGSDGNRIGQTPDPDPIGVPQAQGSSPAGSTIRTPTTTGASSPMRSEPLTPSEATPGSIPTGSPSPVPVREEGSR
jgi:cephalosporin-C deacetylase